MNDLWQPLRLSLGVALGATLLVAVVGVPLAFLMARRRFWGRSLIEAAIILPMVLPPTVAGYLIIVMFGANGIVGSWLSRWLGYSIMFRAEGAVLASAVVALPLLYMPARAAFASVERELEDIARLLGAGRLSLFWHVSLPMARRGITSGLLLAFARGLGEFGATIMVLGWQPGKLTLPISIYSYYEQGEMNLAGRAVVLVSAISFLMVLAYNRSSLARQE